MPIIFQGLSMTELDESEAEVEESTDDIRWTISRACGSILLEISALLGD